MSYEWLIGIQKVKATSSIAATHRHVSARLDEADCYLTACLCACVQPAQPEAAPGCGATAGRPSLRELITPLAFLSPHPPYQAVPSGNTCITELCSSVQGALDNFLLTAHPTPPLSRLPTILSMLLHLPLSAVDEMETSLQQRERSSGYLPQDVFTEERPSLRRQSAQCCIDLTRRKAKGNVGEECGRVRQSRRNVFSNRIQTSPTFILVPPDPTPNAIPTSSFCCCGCCIHKQAVRCLGVKLFLSISAIIEWVLL